MILESTGTIDLVLPILVGGSKDDIMQMSPPINDDIIFFDAPVRQSDPHDTPDPASSRKDWQDGTGANEDDLFNSS